MRVQINKEGRTRYNRQYFFPRKKENRIHTEVYFKEASVGEFWSKFTVADMIYDTLSIVFYCPHCGLQMYGTWYRHEQFIAKRAGHTDGSCKFESSHWLPEYGMTFSKLWELAEKEQRAYAETSKRIEQEISAVRAMQTCPICGKELPQKLEHEDKCSGLYSYYYDDRWDRFCEESFHDFIYNYKNYSLGSADEAIRNIKNAALYQDADIDRTKLTNNSDILLRFLKHILNTEMTVQLLEKRLYALYASRRRYQEAYIRQQAEEMSVIAGAHYSSINVNKPASDRKPTINDVVLDEMKPVAPQFNEQTPIEPVYVKPGMFNKKKAQSQNELLRSNYEAKCQAYRSKKEEYDKQLEAYASEMKLYQQKMREAFDCLLKEYNRKEDARKRREEASQKAFIDNISRTKAEITEQLGSYVLYQETLKEIQRTEELYSQSYACLQSLYSCGVVYEKYRNPVALASFYDYLAAGRCTTLTGADGAYNIYESEVRLDRIVIKLDVVIKQLEQIKNNQYALYSEMSKMNANLETINSTARSMAASLENIKDYQKNISDNTAIIAHNTAVTAFYAKKNAELTNALGFMIALK